MYTDSTGQFIDYIFDAIFLVWGIYDLVANEGYKDWKNWVALCVDIVFAVIPFIPSGAGKAAKFADNGLDLLSAANKIG